MSSRKRRRKPAAGSKRAGNGRGSRQEQHTEGGLGELCRTLLDDTAAQARLVLAGAPTLGPLRIDAPYTGCRDPDDTTARGPMPVAIIEPPTTVRVPLTGRSGRSYDLRTAISVKLGLHPLGPGTTTVPPAVNWAFEYGKSSALLDPTGTPVATFTVPDDPEWLSQANRHGSVAVIYGTNVGVKRPGTIPPWKYDDTARAAELQTSRDEGTVTWGLAALTTR